MNDTQPAVTLGDLRRDPKVNRKALRVIERKIAKRIRKAAFHNGASTGGSVCPKCHAWFDTFVARNHHRVFTCTAGRKLIPIMVAP